MTRNRKMILIVLLSLSLILAAVIGSSIASVLGLTELSPAGTSEGQPTTETGSRPTATLPEGVVEWLGCGFTAEPVLKLAGISLDGPGHYRFYTREDRQIVCDLAVAQIDGTWIIRTAIQNDETGYKLLFSPMPDETEINDYQVVAGPLTLQLGSWTDIATLIEELGTPEADEINAGSEQENRFIRYDGLELEFVRKTGSQPADLWHLVCIRCSEPAYATPRGLAAGISRQKAVRLLGTGEFVIQPDKLPDYNCLTVTQAEPAGPSLCRQISLGIDAGQVAWIEMSLKYNTPIT